MSFDAKQIKIKLETNIPNVKTDVYLTKDVLYHPTITSKTNLSTYPFISEDIRIPKDIIQRLPYKERVKCFFRKEKYLQVLEESSIFVGDNVDDVDILMYNCVTMIELLFPTVFPLINDNRTSYKRYVLSDMGAEFSLKGAIPSVFSWMFPHLKTSFSYLSLNGKTYTVSYTMLLNDILHHPRYKKLITEYDTFSKWKNSKASEIKGNMDTKEGVLMDLLSNEASSKSSIWKQLGEKLSKINRDLSDLEKSRSFVDNINRKKNIVDMIENLQEIEKEYPSTNIKEVARKISIVAEIFRKEKSLFNFDTTTISTLYKIFDTSDEFLLLNILRNDYFSKNINGDLEVSSSSSSTSSSSSSEGSIANKVKSYMNRNYPKYEEFIKLLHTYNNSSVETSNKDLQQLLKGIATKEGSERFSDVIGNIKAGNYSDPSTQQAASTGIDKRQDYDAKTSYEATAFIFVIGGELNENNIQSINCDYYNYDLGRTYELAKNKSNRRYELDLEKRHFYDMNDLIVGKDVDKVDDAMTKGGHKKSIIRRKRTSLRKNYISTNTRSTKRSRGLKYRHIL